MAGAAEKEVSVQHLAESHPEGKLGLYLWSLYHWNDSGNFPHVSAVSCRAGRRREGAEGGGDEGRKGVLSENPHRKYRVFISSALNWCCSGAELALFRRRAGAGLAQSWHRGLPAETGWRLLY